MSNILSHAAVPVRLTVASPAPNLGAPTRLRRAATALCRWSVGVGLLVATGSAAAALTGSMSFLQTGGYTNPIYLGDIAALEITLSNSVATPITGTAFTNTPLPGGLVVAGAGLTTYTCTNGDGTVFAPTGSVTANLNGNSIVLAGATVPPASGTGQGGSCKIVVEVTSRTPADQGLSLSNTIAAATITGMEGATPVSNPDAAQASLTISTLLAPTISKSFLPNTVVKNDQPSTLTITIGNAGNSKNLPLNDVGDTPQAFAIQDTLPSGLKVASPTGVSISCPSGTPPTFAPLANDTVLTATGGIVAAGGSCTLKVNVIGTDANGSTSGGNFGKNFANTIRRIAHFGNRRGLVPALDAADVLRVRSPLTVTQSFNPDPVSDGKVGAKLTITLTNDGGSALTSVGLVQSNIKSSGSGTGSLATTGFVSNCGGTLVANGGTGYTFSGGTIGANSNCTLVIDYTPTLADASVPETFENSIADAAVTNAQGEISNLSKKSVTVVGELTVGKSANGQTIAAPGNPVKFTITVRNFTGGVLNGVKISDPLPGGMVALKTAPYAPAMSGAGCAGTLTDNVTHAVTTAPELTFDMAAGSGASPSVCAVDLWAMVPTNAGSSVAFNNQIPVNGVCSGTVCNAGTSQSVGVTTPAASAGVLTVAKTFISSTIGEGGVSQAVVTFTNLSAMAMTGASFTDSLPIGTTGLQLTVANPSNASSTCAGAAINAAPGALSFGLTGATIPARANNGTGAFGTCVLKVNVTGGAGSYINRLLAGAITATETRSDGSNATASSPGPVNTSLTITPALAATKSFSPSIVQSGGRSTVTVRLSNTSAGASATTLNNVSVLDDGLPPGMTVASPANAYTTCSGPTSVTATPGASTASMTGATIPSGGQCDFLFDVVASGTGPWTNTIAPGKITAAGGVQNVTAVSSTLTEGTGGGLAVTNIATPNNLLAPGQTSILTINLVNNGLLDLSNLQLTDYFTDNGLVGGAPNGMRIPAAPNASTNCTGGAVGATADGTSVSLSGASLVAGASCQVFVNVTLLTAGTVQDTIPANAITTAQGVTNSAPTVTSLSAGASLGITKEFIPAVVKPNERARLRITIINPLALPVTNLAVTDNLPVGLSIPAIANPTTTCTGATVSAPTTGSVKVSNGSLPGASGGVSSTCIAEIDVVAAAEGIYTNTIPGGSITSTVGSGSGTNPEDAVAKIYVKSPLQVQKAIDSKTLDGTIQTGAGFTTGSASATAGTAKTLTIRLRNPNTTALTGAAFTDTLPTGLVVAITPNASTTCTGGTVVAAASATEVRLAGATIPAAGFCTVMVNVLSNTPGLYTNTIAAGGVTTTEGVTNEDPTRTRVEISNPPKVSKQFSPAVIPPNGTSTLTIFLGNDNSTALTLTSAFVDTLPTAPGNIVVATPANIVKTCPGGVTAAAGGATVTYANGATIPAGGCTITVDVTGATAGVHTNNIPADNLKTNGGSNQDPANATLTISTLGYVSGKVFRDNNSTPNGIFDGTDAPIPGVSIELRSGATCGGALVGSATTTDAAGNYLFSGLAAGTYSVCEPVQPSGTNNGTTTTGIIVPVAGSGGTAGTASNPTTTSSQIVNVQLTAGVGGEVSGSTNNNFAEIVPSSISGKVFLDQNDNGVENAADTALSGVQIELLDGANAVVAITTTDAAGNYSFSNLSPGTYSVREPTQPSGTANGKTMAGAAVTGGAAGTETAQNTVASLIATIVLPPNQASTGNNFAEVPAGRQVSGRVFLDPNEDGLFSTGESGLSGVTLNLTGNDFNGIAVSRTIQTTSDGRYVFTGLPESDGGGYTVTEPTQPSGTRNGITKAGTTGGVATAIGVAPSIISAINLAGFNTISADNNFAEVLIPAPIDRTISGKVFRDNDNSGSFNGTDQGIGGQTINLTGTDIYGNTVTRTTATAANGSYSFTGLLEGTYTVSQPAQPVGTSNGTTVAGTTGGVASNPTASSSQIVNIDLKAGNTVSVNNDFAEIVGVTPDLVVTKAASKDVFTEGNLGAYVLRVKNAGLAATNGVYTVTDSLPVTSGTPAKWTIDSASGNGWSCTVSADKLSVSCDASAVLQPGMENPSAIAVSVRIASGAAAFGPLRNVVQVIGGGEPDDKKPKPGEVTNPGLCAAAPTQNVCYVETPLQRAAGLSGHVWIDGGLKKVLEPGDKRLPQWIVEIYDTSDPAAQGKTFTELVRGGLAMQTFTTDSQGYYEACNLQPNSTYRVLFRDPANRIAFPGVVTNEQGSVTGADYFSQVKDREGFQVLEVKLPSASGGPGCGGAGVSAPEQSLPLDPNGVVYDSRTRAPVPGAKVTLIPEGVCTGYDPKLHIINYETYAKDAQGNPTMTVGDDGFYKFLLSGDPTAPKSCQFRLALEAPAGFKQPPSGLIPPSGPLNTPAGPGIFEVQPQKPPPTGTQSTTYHFLFLTGLNHQEIFNNHLPLDLLIPGKLALTKRGDKRLAEVGDTVQYTITVHLREGDPVAQATVRDRLPAGFTLVPGTVLINNLLAPNPLGVLGPVLAFNVGPMVANTQATVTYRVRVGVGAMQGDGINRAQAHGCQIAAGCVDPVTLLPLNGGVESNEGQYKVEVTGGVFTDEACVLGKVFVDCNNNHIQDREELGIPGVRLYFSDGHFVVSDSEGKYSRCGIAPRSHVLTPDPSTLPKGSRLTTSSNRNLGDANSLFLDIKNGELHRADFIEGSCSNTVLEQVKARRTQGEVRSIETEKSEGPALRFLSKPLGYPQQGTDSANQSLVQPRSNAAQAQGTSDAR